MKNELCKNKKYEFAKKQVNGWHANYNKKVNTEITRRYCNNRQCGYAKIISSTLCKMDKAQEISLEKKNNI